MLNKMEKYQSNMINNLAKEYIKSGEKYQQKIILQYHQENQI